MATRLKWFLVAVLVGVGIGLYLSKRLRARHRAPEETEG